MAMTRREISMDYESLFNRTFNQPAVGMALVAPDGMILRANDFLSEMLGYPREELEEKTFTEITHPSDRELDNRNLTDLVQNRQDSYTMEKRYLHSDGEPIWARLTVEAVRNDRDEVEYFVGVVEDVSDQKSVESEKERLSTVVEIQREVAMSDLELDSTIQRVADAARKVTNAEGSAVELARGKDMVYRGVSGNMDEFVGLHLPIDRSFSGLAYRENQILVCSDSQEDERVQLKKKARQTGFISGICVPMFYKNQTFGVITVQSSESGMFDDRDRSTLELLSGLLSSQISHALRFEDTLLDARSDDLTGLKNRRSLQEELNIEIERARRSGDSLSLVMMDIDHFKLVNDSHGHVIGDKVLEKIGDILDQQTRAIDSAFRYGGEEFALIVPEETADGASELANRIRNKLSEVEFQGKNDGSFHVTCSAGIAEFQSDLTPKEFIDHADQALYRAKEAGRDCTVIHGETTNG